MPTGLEVHPIGIAALRKLGVVPTDFRLTTVVWDVKAKVHLVTGARFKRLKSGSWGSPRSKDTRTVVVTEQELADAS